MVIITHHARTHVLPSVSPPHSKPPPPARHCGQLLFDSSLSLFLFNRALGLLPFSFVSIYTIFFSLCIFNFVFAFFFIRTLLLKVTR